MISDRPRRIQKKEIAAEIAVTPTTLSRLIRAGLRLPLWPCTMAECVRAVRDFRDRFVRAEDEIRPC